MSREVLLVLGWLGGATFALLMLWAMWWSLFSDRSRGQRRCPRCWHLVHEAVGLQCGECGHRAGSERELFATRRRWRLALLAFVALLAATLYLRVTIANNGWWTLLPDRALLALLPWMPEQGDAGDVRSELRRRLVAGGVDTADCVRMLAMVRDGTPSAPVGSDAWARSYGPWLEPLRNRWAGADADDPLRLAAATLPPVMVLDLPEGWPSDQPLVVVNRVEDWWPDGVQVRIHVEGVDGLRMQPDASQALQACEWTRSARRGFGGGFALHLGTLPEGLQQGTLRLAWETRDQLHADRVMAQGECALPVRLEITAPAPPLTAVDDEPLRELVRQAFANGMLRRDGADPQYAFSYRTMVTDAPELAATAFGLIVEACEDGVPRRTLPVWWRGGGVRDVYGWDAPIEDLPGLASATESDHWTLRIRGDLTLAQRAALPVRGVRATQYWSGTVQMPLRVTTMPASQPGRSWTLGRRPVTAPR